MQDECCKESKIAIKCVEASPTSALTTAGCTSGGPNRVLRAPAIQNKIRCAPSVGKCT